MAKAPAPAQPMTSKAAPASAAEREVAPELAADDTTPGDDTISDGGEVSPRGAEPPPPPEPAPKPQRRMSPSDEMRANIAKRFSTDRGNDPQEPDRPFSGDMNDPALMGKFGEQPAQEPIEGAPEPGVPPDDEPPAPPPQIVAKRTVIVRGQKLELTEDEIIAAAQRGLAGDSYLDDARRLADDAARERQQTGRTTPAGEHPAGENGAPEAGEPPTDRGEHPARERPFKGLVEKLQYASDPEEIERELENTLTPLVDRAAQARSGEAIISDRMRDDLARSQKALTDFASQNSDIASDPMAQAVMERTIYDLYRQDLTGIGLSAEQLPKDPRQLADWHRYYRTEGYTIRDVPTILNAAKDKLTSWRGTPVRQQQQQRTPDNTPPRVAVNVDRTERRRALPTQPPGSVAPVAPGSRAAAQAPSREDQASSVIMAMKRGRGQPVA